MPTYGTATLTAIPGRADVGQAVRLTVTVRDQAGALVDPATCTITVRLPDGTSTPIIINSLTHDGTGLFHTDYLPAAGGGYTGNVTTTVPNAAGDTAFAVTDPTPRAGFPSGYVTVAEFKAMPTRLAVDQLVVGAIAKAQDAELADVLTRSSAWADSFCNLPAAATLGAKTVSLMRRVKVDRSGDIRVPVGTVSRIPIIVSTLGYGGSRTTLTALSDLTSVLVQAGIVTVTLGGYTGAWAGALQLGSPPPGADLWASLGLIIGWPSTLLTVDAAAAATTITVADPTGILPGAQLQLPDPGAEELVTVLSVAANVVTLTGPLASTHNIGAGVTAIPADIREAVAYAACARIVTPGTQTNPLAGAARKTGKQQAGQDATYQGMAECLLAPYRRSLP